jgi:hypothetical protein
MKTLYSKKEIYLSPLKYFVILKWGLSYKITISAIKHLSMKQNFFFVTLVLVFFGISPLCFGEQTLQAIHVDEPPVIDGITDDPAWENAQEIESIDKTSKLPVRLKAVYTDTKLFLQVRFPDQDESRMHKSWTWDTGREIYTVGYDREDTFILKWNMLQEAVDLSIFADSPHHADVWFWKACRTDASGYADDKSHLLRQTDERGSTKIISRSGNIMYLLRRGDDGTSAYGIDLITDYQDKVMPRYISRHPTGSRSDVKAKGVWEDGAWTIEFQRNLRTGQQDDIQFTTDRKFLFGISRYEIAGRSPNPKLSAPLYGTGDVSEPLWLEFIK